MYQQNIGSNKEAPTPSLGLNAKSSEDMYLDTSMLSPSILPTSPPPNVLMSSLWTPTPTDFKYNLNVQKPITPMKKTEHYSNVNKQDNSARTSSIQQKINDSVAMMNGLHGIQDGGIGLQMPSAAVPTEQQLFCQQYQKQLLVPEQHSLYKQQIDAAQEIAISDASIDETLDEMSKSLRMYSMYTAFKDAEQKAPEPTMDDIMQDFASNGHTSDDLNRNEPPYQASAQPFVNQNQNFNTNNAAQIYQPNLNIDWNMRNNFWNMLPIPTPTQLAAATAAAVTAAAAFNFDCRQFTNLPKRINGKYSPPQKRCVFCDNNREPELLVRSHAVRDIYGRVLCPKLRTYVCPICGESGDNAHTIKYCPKKPIITMEDAVQAQAAHLAKSTAKYIQQMKM